MLNGRGLLLTFDLCPHRVATTARRDADFRWVQSTDLPSFFAPTSKGVRENETYGRLAIAVQSLEEQNCGHNAADIDHEHHWVAPLMVRQQLAERVEQRLLEDALGDERARHRWNLRYGRAADLRAHIETSTGIEN
jgi:hypothetical protein